MPFYIDRPSERRAPWPRLGLEAFKPDILFNDHHTLDSSRETIAKEKYIAPYIPCQNRVILGFYQEEKNCGGGALNLPDTATLLFFLHISNY